MRLYQNNRKKCRCVIKDFALAVNTRKTRYMEVGHHRDMMANEHITVDSNLREKMKTFKYLGSKFYSGGNIMWTDLK